MTQRCKTVVAFKKLITFKEGKIGNKMSNYTEDVLIRVCLGHYRSIEQRIVIIMKAVREKIS